MSRCNARCPHYQLNSLVVSMPRHTSTTANIYIVLLKICSPVHACVLAPGLSGHSSRERTYRYRGSDVVGYGALQLSQADSSLYCHACRARLLIVSF